MLPRQRADPLSDKRRQRVDWGTRVDTLAKSRRDGRPTRWQAHVRISWPTRESAGPRANQRAHLRGVGRAFMRVRSLDAVSHAIRLGELSIMPTNVAIPTMWICSTTKCWGNCMRNSWAAHPTGIMRYRSYVAGSTADGADGGAPLAEHDGCRRRR